MPISSRPRRASSRRRSQGRASPSRREARRHQAGPHRASPRLHLERRGSKGAGDPCPQARQPRPGGRCRLTGAARRARGQAAARAQAHPEFNRSPALAGALADRPGKPPGCARARQPSLAVSFRPGFGRNFQRSRCDGRRSLTPRVARVVSYRIDGRRWRLKPLHRLIVLSQTYQLSSENVAGAAKIDPDNTLLWRAPTASARRRSDPRFDPGRERPVEHPNDRPRLLSDSAKRRARRAVAAWSRLG